MKHIKMLITCSVMYLLSNTVQAQNLFMDKGTIEYEVRTNNFKTVEQWRDEDEQEGAWEERYKDKNSKFTVTYYDLIFAQNQSAFVFKKLDDNNKAAWDNENNYNSNKWYYNFNENKVGVTKMLWGDETSYTDTIADLKWHIVPNESLIIAGFNCRKAFTILFDSVYVFAFYTDEITVPVGPMNLHGLPGAILGITIPRMYTSLVATKVNVNSPDVTQLKTPTDKKTKTKEQLLKIMNKDINASARWMQRSQWSLFL